MRAADLGRIASKIRRTPPEILLKTAARKTAQAVSGRMLYLRDCLLPTYRYFPKSKEGMVPIRMAMPQAEISDSDREKARNAWKMYRSHRFDLLGSGWVKNRYGVRVYGIDGIVVRGQWGKTVCEKDIRAKDRRREKEVASHISHGYEPIDWQLDFKSGYRWSAKKWYRPQGNADIPGGDIKMPWELSRLQHLPRLAVVSCQMKKEAEAIAKEFCNEVLDFIARNPMRMGVNYMCTMDVGIRIANMAFAYSLFCSSGMKPPKEVDRIFCNFVYENCDFIRKNLEWSDIYTSNHYFADVTGLLYGAAILPDDRRSRAWLCFARNQIEQEIQKQFYEEGSNKEGSTAYHRLTAEMAMYSAAMIHRLSQDGRVKDLSEAAYERIYRACKMVKAITRPDGNFSVVGDNDSGQLFRLSFTGELLTWQEAVKRYRNLKNYRPQKDDDFYYDENVNDGRTLLSAAYGLFGTEAFSDAAEMYPTEAAVVSSLINGKTVAVKEKGWISKPQTENRNEPDVLRYTVARKYGWQGSIDVQALRFIEYPKFGIYIYRGEDFYLLIAMTDNGQEGLSGHTHNDKLSFELYANGELIQEDPGTYVYTALPEERNRYRSTESHNTAYMGEEQNRAMGLFMMRDETRCHVLERRRESFTGMVRYRDCVHMREFHIYRGYLEVIDHCNHRFTVNDQNALRTAGYGKVRY